MAKKIFLVGYMGSGKTTAASLISDRLGWLFTDLDQKIETDMGITITEIFNTLGEDKFRELERIALYQTISVNSNHIVATGGGTPCFFDSMQIMNREGITIYLRLSQELLYNRLVNSPIRINRPIVSQLGHAELWKIITWQLAVREPFYIQARHIIDCDFLSEETIADRVIALI
ncbi:MAG TPA: shikimate kinase [Bacteroidales bacterium]|nr:shikimate kinase [Bacteroidales bacterium]